MTTGLIKICQTAWISGSEVSESLNRSAIAALTKPDKKSVLKESLLEFLVYRYKICFSR